MSQFPLYKSLKKDINDMKVDKQDFIKKFKLIDRKSHQLIYILIKSYQIDNKINILSSLLPFSGIRLKTKGSIKFSFKQFSRKFTKNSL